MTFNLMYKSDTFWSHILHGTTIGESLLISVIFKFKDKIYMY
ncbi:hypothetical protein DDB_G0290705 [Dictyostelium discoideum AX4]|nr:hypothetical protein DDB_G0290705 [Dictyostelium discoideum AX4]EAL62087.1 hypothetical protein DDB_G0290705 [Dictyostelium discoideum AX4]|eukprot:XP_635591.1 hypothetical protein DDB_G0290705 [Dictyostelium discoideum AX4]